MKFDRVAVKNYRTGKTEIVYKESLLNLANAIIEQAVFDYKDDHCSKYDEHQIEQFFLSDYFIMLSRGCVSPDSIIKHLKGGP